MKDAVDSVISQMQIYQREKDFKLKKLDKFINQNFSSFNDYMANLFFRNSLYKSYCRPYKEYAFEMENYIEEYVLVFDYVSNQPDSIFIDNEDEVALLTKDNPFVSEVIKYKGYLFYWMHGQGSIPIIEKE